MRILYYAGIDLSLPQGHAVHVRRLCQALEARGHCLFLVSRVSSGALDWSGPSGGWQACRGWPIPKLRHLTAESSSLRTLRKEARRFQPDLVLTRIEDLTFAPLFLRPRLSSKGGLRRRPLVAECNAAQAGFSQAGGASRIRQTLLHQVAGGVLRAADSVGMVTDRLVEILVPAHRLVPSRVFVVPNGAWIPPCRGSALTDPRRRRAVRDETCLFAFAGNLHPMQGLEGLLRSMARQGAQTDGRGGMRHGPLPEIHLWIIGHSPERRRLEGMAESLGLRGRVEFLGGLPETEAVQHLQAAQAIVAPYPSDLYGKTGAAAENLKLLQGLACDRPLLVGPLPGLERVLAGAALRRVRGDDPDAWSRTMTDLAREWRAAGCPLQHWPWPEGEGPGRTWVAAHRTWDHSAARWEVVFEHALRSARR